MNTTTALFKKELHTAKWFLLGGILFFWSFPLLDMAGRYYQNGTLRTDMPSAMVLVFGAMFAIVTAAGLVCLDMPKGLHEFWRSRPVGLAPYLLVKYSVGLAAVLFVITAPILFEMILFRKAVYNPMASFQGSVCFFHSFVIILIYSIAFYTGHLFRNMNEAIIISCAAALLVYFVPLLVPVLERLSFISILDEAPVLNGKSVSLFLIYENIGLFIITAIVLSTLLFCAAWICLKYHLQVQLGMKSMCWTLGLVALILFSAAAFSVGSNLKCVAKVPLSMSTEKSVILSSCFDDTEGVVLCGRYESETFGYDMLRIDRISEEPSYAYRQESYSLETQFSKDFPLQNSKVAWSKQNPDIVYFLGAAGESKQGNAILCKQNLYVIKLEDDAHTARILSELPLIEYDTKKAVPILRLTILDSQKIYLQIPDEIIIIDISDTSHPQLLTKFAYQNCIGGGENWLRFTLPVDKSLSEQQQRNMIWHTCWNSEMSFWDGNRYAEAVNDLLRVYTIDKIDGTEIHLKKIADRQSLPLEKLMEYYPRKLILRGDTIYLLNGSNSLAVYQLNEPSETLKNIGHYIAPEGRFYDMFLRDDGLIALVGDSQLHIIQPPVVKD